MARLILISTLLILAHTGCAHFPSMEKLNFRTIKPSPIADLDTAQKKHELGISFLGDCCYDQAEQCLREALLADVSFGPAHNTLGKVYFDQKKFYLAAWEFEYAMKTMPNRPEPSNNLGLVYEAVDQLDNAIAYYQTATALAPENPQYLGNLLRARIRRGEVPQSMEAELRHLIFIDDRQPWVDWAKKQLVFNPSSQLPMDVYHLSDGMPVLDGNLDGNHSLEPMFSNPVAAPAPPIRTEVEPRTRSTYENDATWGVLDPAGSN